MEEHNLIYNVEAPPVTPDPPSQPRSFGPPKRSRRRQGWLGLLLGFTVLFLVAFTTFFVAGSRFYAGVTEGQTALENAQEAAINFEFEEASTELATAKESFIRIQNGLKLVRWMYPVPWIGDQVKGVTAIVDAGVESIEAIENALLIAADVFAVIEEAEALLAIGDLPGEDYSFEDFPQEQKAELLQALHNAHPKLVEMGVQLRLAQEDLDELEGLNLHKDIEEAIAPFQELLPDLIAGIDFMIPLSATVGEVAGVNQDRQWLMLFLNNTEIRPGGGFVGVYGLITMRDGEIVEMDIGDTYEVDLFAEQNPDYHMTPPLPIQYYLAMDEWFFRDGNWSPDFPTSAQDMTQLMRQEFAAGNQPVPEVHGVVGFTPDLAEDVMAVTGPVIVQGIEFNADNVTEVLQFEVEFGFEGRGDSYEDRKAIMDDLVDAVLDKLMTMPVERWADVFAAVTDAFIKKHLAVFSFDLQSQSAFEDAGWAAEIDPEGYDDVLMVVDANLGGLKSDPFVDREISYTVERQGDDFIATTKITYMHTGTYSLTVGRYRSWARVYAPLGSELISSHVESTNDPFYEGEPGVNEITVADELGMTSFGRFVSVPPGEVGTLEYTYKLPEETARAMRRGVYELAVFKQMGGLDTNALTLDIDFGKKLKSAVPEEDRDAFGDTRYQVNTILDQNLVFTVQH